MNIYSIYRVTNKINNKVYIGFTRNFEQRKREHKYAHTRKVNKFYTAINKHGWENFSWEVIYQSLNGSHCNSIMEPHFIVEYDSCGRNSNGYNLTVGGESGAGDFNSKDWVVTNPNGEEIKVNNLHRFCSRNELSSPCMFRVANHGSKHHRGWKCRYAENDVRTPIYKFICTDKDGIEFYVENLRQFCISKGLIPAGMSNVIRGKVKTYKGWLCSRI